MNILNLPHLNRVPDDLRGRVDRIWISDKKGTIITKSDEVYIINIDASSDPVIRIPELCGKQVIDVIFGQDFMFALNENGQIYSWGENGFGQLGLGHKTKTQTPTIIASLSAERVIKIACGDEFAIALCENGKVFHWGYSTDKCAPTRCSEANSGINIACCFSCLRLDSYSDDGELRNSEKQIYMFYETGENKVRFPGGYLEFENIIQKVVCGHRHVLVLDSNGKVQVAGNEQKSFIHLDISEKIIDIAASPYSTVSAAMTDSKTIYVWNGKGDVAIRPYPTYFVSFQEVFLILSEPKMTYGVFHLKDNNSTKDLKIDVLESIIKEFDEPKHSDLTILVEEKKIHVHKMILNARSTYFRTMFQEQWQENIEKQVEVKDYSYDGFKNYLKYLYGMEIDITSKNVIDLMKIADHYMDKTLEQLILKKVENDETISRPIKLLKKIMELPTWEYEVLCEGINRLVFSKDSSSKL